MSDDKDLTEEKVQDILRLRLPSHRVPEVMKIDSVPLLPNGKTDRQGLIKRFECLNNAGWLTNSPAQMIFSFLSFKRS